MPTRFWGDVQRARYGRFPDAIGEDDSARCFHLDERDQAIITELRGAHNRLGFPRPSPRRTPTSARPQFRIGLLQRLMSVDRSSRTHGPASGPAVNNDCGAAPANDMPRTGCELSAPGATLDYEVDT